MTLLRSLLPLTIAATMLLSACGSDPAPSPATPEPVTVTTAVADEAPMQTISRYSGTLRGNRRVPLSTKMMGTITDLDLDVGDRVRAGQTLARVQSQSVRAQKRQVEARLQEADAALQNAKTNFERIQALKERESATQKEFDDAQTAYQSAQARVEALKSQLDEINDTLNYATITSPISGFVVDKRAEEGGFATPGRPLLVVESLDDLKAVVQVPEADINRFSVGDSVTVEVGAAGNARRPGVVTQINPSGNYASRQFEVQVRLQRSAGTETAAQALKSGMYAQLLYPMEESAALTVPQKALVHRGQLTGLFTVTDSTALLRWVRVGETRGDRVEVLSGLRSGETYVADTSPRLLDGQPVRAQ